VQQPIAFLDQLSDTGVSGFARVCGAPVKFVQDCLFDVAGGVVGASPGGVAGGIVGIERTKPFGLDDVDDAVVKARGFRHGDGVEWPVGVTDRLHGDPVGVLVGVVGE